MAEHDHSRIQQLLDWPLRELFLRYLHMIRVDAWQKYNASLMVWATLAPHQQKPKRAPKVPSILKEDSDG